MPKFQHRGKDWRKAKGERQRQMGKVSVLLEIWLFTFNFSLTFAFLPIILYTLSGRFTGH